MKFLYKMEARYGKYAVRNLSLYIAIVLVFSYVLQLLLPNVYVELVYSPYLIFNEHEWWRIFTWIFTTPGPFDMFTLIMIFFYYSVGTSIERAMGSFMYNLYIFGGLIITTVSITVASAISHFANPNEINFTSKGVTQSMLTYFFTISIFLGYALVQTDSMVYLWFVIPFKVKWLAYIDLAFLGYYFVTFKDFISRVAIVSTIANFVIFYMIMKRYSIRRGGSARALKRKIKIRTVTNDNVIPINITRHKCAICGKTERDDEMMEFRFCSKCNGNYEFCKDHLYTHEHFK